MKTNSVAACRNLFLGILLIATGVHCSSQNNKKYIGKVNYNNSSIFSDSELVVWMKPGGSKGDFKKYIDSLVKRKHFIPRYCTDCDETLALLTGPGAATTLGPVATGATGGSTGTGGGPSGGGFYWMVNFKMDVNDPIEDTRYGKEPNEYPKVSFSGAPVVVGVLDTGVDTTNLRKTGFLYDAAGMPASCLGNRAANGWNFCVPNNDLSDEYHPIKGHGANVAWLIKEKCSQFNQAQAKVLPVKVIPGNGPAKLYDVLCGLAYATERGAKIINASLGYYSCNRKDYVDSGSIIFGEYIKYYLTRNNILLVAAAGNVDDKQQKASCGIVTRSLDKMNFFPASFARNNDMKNVIAVTTISAKSAAASVSPLQNYSNKVIDIGVHADMVSGSHYRLKNNRFANAYIDGSSYATPIVSGIIAAYYNLLIGSGINIGNKYQVINQLIAFKKISVDNAYTGSIKGRNVADH